MTDKNLISAWINPLFFFGLDKPIIESEKKSLKIENFINYLCTPGIGCSIEDLSKRYKEISIEKERLNAAPAESRILEKLIWPLRHAKACYMVGNYLGTISLCGMVAEMIAIFYFDISDFKINKNQINDKKQKELWGCTFEKLGQKRRVDILRKFGVISSEIKNKFDLIRTNRNKYLHLWSKDHEILPFDAVKSYLSILSIVVSIIGQDIENRRIKINPKILKYLEKSGVYEPSNE